MKERLENFIFFFVMWLCTTVVVLTIIGYIFEIIIKIKQ